jgi:dephospho-CoA kinase
MGKTTVSNYLATTHQVSVLDADVLAREAVEPGSPILHAIAERYGSGILRTDGSLDRHRLGDIVFKSPPERLWLEQQIHPYVRDRLISSLRTPPLNDPVRHPIVVLVVPLLFEARLTNLVTEIWVIQCSNNEQFERLMQRDQLSAAQVQMRINSQMSIQKKLAQADVVLDNSSTVEELFRQVDRALAQPVNQLTTVSDGQRM